MTKIPEKELEKVQGGAGPKSKNLPAPLGGGGGHAIGEPDGGDKVID
jgi:hypothetical protein